VRSAGIDLRQSVATFRPTMGCGFSKMGSKKKNYAPRDRGPLPGFFHNTYAGAMPGGRPYDSRAQMAAPAIWASEEEAAVVGGGEVEPNAEPYIEYQYPGEYDQAEEAGGYDQGEPQEGYGDVDYQEGEGGGIQQEPASSPAIPMEEMQPNDGEKSRNVFEGSADMDDENEHGFDMVGMPSFKESLRNAIDRLVIVMFYEDNCDDCHAMGELLQEFVLMYPKVLFLEANVKANPDAVKALRVRYLPTFIAFKNHLEVGRLVDVDAEQLEIMIANS